MKTKSTLPLLAAALLCAAGCASVPLQSADRDAFAKEFNPPPKGYSGLYIYRNSFIGAPAAQSLYVDNQYIGMTANKTFYYRMVRPGAHMLQTQTERGLNEKPYEAAEGKNHYFRQTFLPGITRETVKLDEIEEAKAQEAIRELSLAVDADEEFANADTSIRKDGKGSVPAWVAFGKKAPGSKKTRH